MDHWKTPEARTTGNVDVFERMRQFKQHRNNVGAWILGAKLIGDTKLVQRLQLLSQIMELEPHLLKPLFEYQKILYDELKQKAYRAIPPDQLKEFYKSI